MATQKLALMHYLVHCQLLTLLISKSQSLYFDPISGTIIKPVGNIDFTSGYWTHSVIQDIPCVTNMISADAIKLIHDSESQVQSAISKMVEAHKKLSSLGPINGILTSNVALALTTQSGLNNRLMNIWPRLIMIIDKLQLVGDVFYGKACQDDSYLLLVKRSFNITKIRALHNSDLVRVIIPHSDKGLKPRTHNIQKSQRNFQADSSTPELPNDLEKSNNSTESKINLRRSVRSLSEHHNSGKNCMIHMPGAVVHNMNLNQYSKGKTHVSENKFDHVQNDPKDPHDSTPKPVNNRAQPYDLALLLKHLVSFVKRSESLGPRITSHGIIGIKGESTYTIQSLDKYRDSIQGISVFLKEDDGDVLSKGSIGVTLCVHEDAKNYIGSALESCSIYNLKTDEELFRNFRTENEMMSDAPRTRESFLRRPGMRLPPNLRRLKRSAPLSLLTKWFYRPIFGFASEDDLIEIRSYLTNVVNTTNNLVENSNNQRSINQKTLESLTVIEESIKVFQTNLNTHINNTIRAFHDIKVILENLDQENHLRDIIDGVQGMQLHQLMVLEMLESLIIQIESFYTGVSDYRHSAQINSIQSHFELIEEIKSSINSKVSPKMRVSEPWSKLPAIDVETLISIPDQRKIVSIIRVPLVDAHSNITVYELKTLPIVAKVNTSQYVIQVETPGDIMVLDSTYKLHMYISTSEYNLCRATPGFICPLPRPWKLFGESTACDNSLIKQNGSSDILKNCQLKTLNNPNLHVVTSLPLTETQWVISVINGPVSGTYSCLNSTNITRGFYGLSVTTLVNCNLTIIDNFHPHFSGNLSSNSTWNIPPQLALSSSAVNSENYVIMAPEIMDIMKEDNIIQRKMSNLEVFQVPDTRWVEALEMKLKDLNSSIQATKKLNKVSNSPFPNGFNSWSYLEWSIGVGVVVVSLLIVIRCIKNCRYMATPAGGAIILSKLTQSEAAISAANITTLPLINSTFNSTLNYTWSHTHAHLQNYHPLSNYIFMLLMIMFMLWHCIQLNQLSFQNQLLHRRLQIYPGDKNIKYHIGENALLVTLCVKLTNLIGLTSEEYVGISITTLPPPGNQYYIVDATNVRYACKGTSQWITPFSDIKFMFDWRHCCIKSSIIPTLDTCTSLPPIIKISKSLVLNQLNIFFQFLWVKFSVISVTNIHIGTPQGLISMYDYTNLDLED
ncbi:hypothetical protein 1 [Atrato Chu-like virus 5]|uniref:Uncharacterized protein n=1 Tax=Atrato Chu-like virus 5 TaxID=2689325 RepID=A0A6B9KN05_9VIRU|nr:hypothetical protein 1 [Atrato Chu-like virus 5]QHA33673.1 hypothetical protein 1 [Atrato Chu-like virus 5]